MVQVWFIRFSDWVQLRIKCGSDSVRFRRGSDLVQILVSGLAHMCVRFGSHLIHIWFRFGSGLVQIWFRLGADLVQVWLCCGSGLVQIWFRFGSDLGQVTFGSDFVHIWLIFGSYVVRRWYGLGIARARARPWIMGSRPSMRSSPWRTTRVGIRKAKPSS